MVAAGAVLLGVEPAAEAARLFDEGCHRGIDTRARLALERYPSDDALVGPRMVGDPA